MRFEISMLFLLVSAMARVLEIGGLPVVWTGILFPEFVFGRALRLLGQFLRSLDRHGQEMKAEQSRKERQACIFE
ncbi:MAG: hypothetical protein CVU60_07315 [Deltaproteobacteria bacterium HGW-Deltaproteobacteria-18]|nr:MAG: hypothetical protein CVU60_07315 [Deltaproteobacteria bacterium HGW-Deltaproteobacteria-18]